MMVHGGTIMGIDLRHLAWSLKHYELVSCFARSVDHFDGEMILNLIGQAADSFPPIIPDNSDYMITEGSRRVYKTHCEALGVDAEQFEAAMNILAAAMEQRNEI
jgi:hypothetical protein